MNDGTDTRLRQFELWSRSSTINSISESFSPCMCGARAKWTDIPASFIHLATGSQFRSPWPGLMPVYQPPGHVSAICLLCWDRNINGDAPFFIFSFFSVSSFAYSSCLAICSHEDIDKNEAVNMKAWSLTVMPSLPFQYLNERSTYL